MKEVVIIFGKGKDKPTGKSFLAKQMSSLFDNPSFLDGRQIKGSISYIPIKDSNDCVIIDDILPDFDFEQLVIVALSGYMSLKNRESNCIIKSPQFIITTSLQSPNLAQLSKHIKGNVKFVETYIEDGIFHAKRVKL